MIGFEQDVGMEINTSYIDADEQTITICYTALQYASNKSKYLSETPTPQK